MDKCFKIYSSKLKVYKLKEFEKILEDYGFTFHHRNTAHNIYANSDHEYVTVPTGKKELNAMMTTVTLQRIKNKQCRKLDINTINRFK